MSRLAWLLSALVAVLIVLLWWFLMWVPTQETIRDVEDRTDEVEALTATMRTRAAELRQVRDAAPEAAAELASADVLIPRDAALPSLLRQLQQAADESGVRLDTVAPSRPVTIETSVGEASRIDLGLSLTGTYFQLIDFTRRLEDPFLTGRGVLWRSMSISRGSSYPTLDVTVTARVFAQQPIDVAADLPGEETDADEEVDDDTLDVDPADEEEPS